MASTISPIAPCPAPWVLKGTIYSFMIYVSSSHAAELFSQKEFLYSPLEKDSPHSNDKPVGGPAMVQLIRYSESPVGPYDEMVVIPGNFEYTRSETGKDGKVKLQKKQNLRITKIFVSQEKTCYNGRKNWNIPKHLAQFNWEEKSDKSLSVSVHPLEAGEPGVEWKPSVTPVFSGTYKSIPYMPSFPSSTNLFKYMGINLSLVQPPLPEGKGSMGELPGTEEWCELVPHQWSPKTSLGWWDLTQPDGETNLGGEKKSARAYFWPGIGKSRLGMLMEDATLDFPAGKHWAEPKI